MATFTVKVSKKFPAYDERDGFTLEVEAESKSAANRAARREMERRGYIGDGPMTFTATRAEG